MARRRGMTVCAGTGRAPASEHGNVYPKCPVCGREFGAQGRKAAARLGNPWRDGIPRHFVDECPADRCIRPRDHDDDHEAANGYRWRRHPRIR